MRVDISRFADEEERALVCLCRAILSFKEIDRDGLRVLESSCKVPMDAMMYAITVLEANDAVEIRENRGDVELVKLRNREIVRKILETLRATP